MHCVHYIVCTLSQGHLLLKDCHRYTFLPIPREIIPKGSIVIHKGVKGWFLIDSSNVRALCTSNDVIRIRPDLLSLLVPLGYSARIELFVNNLNLLYKIATLKIGDEVLVKLDDHNVMIKAVIKYRGTLPFMKGEYFGVELLVSYYFLWFVLAIPHHDIKTHGSVSCSQESWHTMYLQEEGKRNFHAYVQ